MAHLEHSRSSRIPSPAACVNRGITSQRDLVKGCIHCSFLVIRHHCLPDASPEAPPVSPSAAPSPCHCPPPAPRCSCTCVPSPPWPRLSKSPRDPRAIANFRTRSHITVCLCLAPFRGLLWPHKPKSRLCLGASKALL